MREIVDGVLELLDAGSGFALLTVVAEQGSTPRAAGAEMLVLADGSIRGTIGGGLIEATMMAQAAEVIRGQSSRLVAMDLAGTSVRDLEMLCGGRAEVLIAYVGPDDAALREIAAAVKATIDAGRRARLFTFFSGDADRADVSRCLQTDVGEVTGTAPCSPAELRTLAGETGRHGAVALPDGRRLHLEAIEPATPAIICGAGHVGLALAPAAAAAGFLPVVLDDRPEFADPGRFPASAQVQVIGSFEDPFRDVEVTEHSYIVVVTRGHQHDYAALLQALCSPARYVGLMSSRAKRRKIEEALAADGVPAERIASIHSPVGLSIGAETPAELAVSIVAEMIKVRAGLE